MAEATQAQPTARVMPEDAERIIPVRLTDLWLKRSDGQMDVLGDSALYLNHYLLDEISSFIWEQCDGRTNAFEIAESLLKECAPPVPPLEQIIGDVLEALEDLRERNLLSWREAQPCDVLLISPPFPNTYNQAALNSPEFLSPPLGLAYLAAYLRDNGFSVAIKDLHIEGSPPESVLATCRTLNPKIIGLTATTPTYPNALRTARFIKAWNPEIFIILGGVHATGMPAECLADGPFDFVVLGEGEATLLELCTHLTNGSPADPMDVAGLAFHDPKGELVLTSPRKPFQNLDDLPFPSRDLLDLDRYVKKGAVCTSRGCPNNCSFCACHLIFGHRYRTPSVTRVLDELEHLYKFYGINEIDFNDDTFNWDHERVFAICKGIRERGLKLRWSCFCRAAEMTPEIAVAIKEAGCGAVQFGVESGSPKILKDIGKRLSLQQVESAVKACSEAGIEAIVCGIMLGHPEDTEGSVSDTIEFADHLLRIGATRIMLSLLTPYPGTAVYRQAEKLGIKILTDDWEQFILSRVVVETNYLPREKIRELYVGGLIRFLTYEKTMEGFWRPANKPEQKREAKY
jgi:anaerobic magnesium-protoporphyrin IX monomethyl ester cyclase